MRTVLLSELQSESINSIIDENYRFTVLPDSEEEEDLSSNVRDKIALLREECRRITDRNS